MSVWTCERRKIVLLVLTQFISQMGVVGAMSAEVGFRRKYSSSAGRHVNGRWRTGGYCVSELGRNTHYCRLHSRILHDLRNSCKAEIRSHSRWYQHQDRSGWTGRIRSPVQLGLTHSLSLASASGPERLEQKNSSPSSARLDGIHSLVVSNNCGQFHNLFPPSQTDCVGFLSYTAGGYS